MTGTSSSDPNHGAPCPPPAPLDAAEARQVHDAQDAPRADDTPGPAWLTWTDPPPV